MCDHTCDISSGTMAQEYLGTQQLETGFWELQEKFQQPIGMDKVVSVGIIEMAHQTANRPTKL